MLAIIRLTLQPAAYRVNRHQTYQKMGIAKSIHPQHRQQLFWVNCPAFLNMFNPSNKQILLNLIHGNLCRLIG